MQAGQGRISRGATSATEAVVYLFIHEFNVSLTIGLLNERRERETRKTNQQRGRRRKTKPEANSCQGFSLR